MEAGSKTAETQDQGRPGIGGILGRILEARARRVGSRPAPDRIERGNRRPFAAAIRGKGKISLIAEIKKASPSAGILSRDFSPARLADAYDRAGASAISVVTEPEFFGGMPEHLEEAGRVSNLPLLRKDFLLGPGDVAESAAMGADAALVIVAAGSRSWLNEMLCAVAEARIEALVEVHDEHELESAAACGAAIIGVNCRDLRTMKTDFGVFARLLPLVPDYATAIAESGIRSRDDMLRVEALGADAALVGSMLVSAPDPCAAAEALLKGCVHVP